MMKQLVLQFELSAEWRSASEPCEVYDSAGNQLGFFKPQYIGYECPLTTEELLRIEKKGGGRPLADILRDLERKAADQDQGDKGLP